MADLDDDFFEAFRDLEDPRGGNAQRHELLDILFIAICTILSGGETCTDMAAFARVKRDFLLQFIEMRNGPPSHDTFSRVFRLLDPASFHGCFVSFMQRFTGDCKGVIALDGKALRRSMSKAKSLSPLHLVQAFAVEARLVLGQQKVDSKSNEITAVPELLKILSLEGCTVTADAMHCQRDIARQVVKQKGDYVLALKGNQGTLHDDVATFLDDPETPLEMTETVDADHGRIETRKAFVSTRINWLRERHDWPGLSAIGKIERTRENNGQITRETSYYLMSAPLSPERFGVIARAHWGIENALHWVLDVTMNEDQLRNREGHGPENLALLRRLALNLAKLEPTKGSMRGKLKRAAWDETYLYNLLVQFKKV